MAQEEKREAYAFESGGAGGRKGHPPADRGDYPAQGDAPGGGAAAAEVRGGRAGLFAPGGYYPGGGLRQAGRAGGLLRISLCRADRAVGHGPRRAFGGGCAEGLCGQRAGVLRRHAPDAPADLRGAGPNP
ncbi:hypothetical protein SDC9_161382 [bioreactor metagenome]|uniref:Uncharacterized protein n=1 Tax=bioreactor metagenome TaxID=1076179 RepID=A0A645FK68_9ZZZZ